MIELDEQLQRLADSLELPPTTPAEDLARGRARRRHRNLGVAGAALTTAAVIGTSVVLLSATSDGPGAGPGFAGGTSPLADASARAESRGAAEEMTREEALREVQQRAQAKTLDDVLKTQVLSGYRDVLREDLDPAGTRIQTGPITNQQSAEDTLGTKLDWNGGGMLQVAVGRSLEGVQFFCDGACERTTVTGASKALVLTSPGKISVAVFQDDGDIVALTADRSFGNNGTSTNALGLTVEQLLTAAADPRLDAPNQAGQLPGEVGTQ